MPTQVAQGGSGHGGSRLGVRRLPSFPKSALARCALLRVSQRPVHVYNKRRLVRGWYTLVANCFSVASMWITSAGQYLASHGRQIKYTCTYTYTWMYVEKIRFQHDICSVRGSLRPHLPATCLSAQPPCVNFVYIQFYIDVCGENSLPAQHLQCERLVAAAFTCSLPVSSASVRELFQAVFSSL